MHIIMVSFKIKPEHVEAFRAGMAHHIKSTRENEPGCVQFDLSQDKEDPNAYYLYEVYADDAALEAHGKSPTLGPLRENFAVWAEERTLRTARLIPTP